jgi:TetR/AcrR family transcriptional regulator
VLEQGLSLWLLPLSRFTADEDPVAAIEALIGFKLEMSRDHPEVSRLFALEMLRGAPSAEVGAGRTAEGGVRGQVSRWSRPGWRRGAWRVDPSHLIFSIWAITQHYADFAVQVRACPVAPWPTGLSWTRPGPP